MRSSCTRTRRASRMPGVIATPHAAASRFIGARSRAGRVEPPAVSSNYRVIAVAGPRLFMAVRDGGDGVDEHGGVDGLGQVTEEARRDAASLVLGSNVRAEGDRGKPPDRGFPEDVGR